MLNIFKIIWKSLLGGFSLWRRLKNHTAIIEALQTRIIFSCILGVFIFGSVIYRLCDIMVIRNIHHTQTKYNSEHPNYRADITDRNGEVLATSIITASCYADPSVVIDIEDTASKLSKVPGMPSFEKIKSKLSDNNKHFVWLTRHVTPQLQQQIMDMGLPGIFFKKDYKRVYPYGNLFAHVVGCSDTDDNGTSGIEKKFNDDLIVENFSNKKLRLTVDLRIQTIVYEELKAAIEKYNAVGGNAIVMNMQGEILSMVSLPDFDPNNLKENDINFMFNRNTLGAYEPGSTFKILNTAIALESGCATLDSMFDARFPIKIGRFSISDFRGKNRFLSLAEAFVFSSNIAAIKIAQQFGNKTQQDFMKKFGILDRSDIELPEVGSPILPKVWKEASAMTISYGYGISVSPLQLISSVSSIVNAGYKVCPTLLCNNVKANYEHVVSAKTSALIRELMRAVICWGTAKKAAVKGAEIFGKTGTAYKTSGKGYGNNNNRARITTFLGGFPTKQPQTMLLIMLDDPKPTEETYGYATAGWNAAPTAGKIFERIVPLLSSGTESEEESELKVAKYIQLN